MLRCVKSFLTHYAFKTTLEALLGRSKYDTLLHVTRCFKKRNMYTSPHKQSPSKSFSLAILASLMNIFKMSLEFKN
eukprot:UN21987